jgi:hypothetical protein
MTKVYLVLYQGRDRWNQPQALSAWLNEGEARKEFELRKSDGAVFDMCELRCFDAPRVRDPNHPPAGLEDMGPWVPERALISAEAKLSALEGEFAVFRNAYVRLQRELVELKLKTLPPSLSSARGLEHNGHLFPLRGMQSEPDEAANCLRCGVSYAGTGPLMRDPCPKDGVSPDVETVGAFQTLEEWGKEHFSPEFLAEADSEYRRAEVAAEDHDLCWLDGILPRWEFYRQTGGGLYVGIDEETGDSVEGPTEEAVYQAAIDLDMERVEWMLAGEDEEQGA